MISTLFSCCAFKVLQKLRPRSVNKSFRLKIESNFNRSLCKPLTSELSCKVGNDAREVVIVSCKLVLNDHLRSKVFYELNLGGGHVFHCENILHHISFVATLKCNFFSLFSDVEIGQLTKQ